MANRPKLSENQKFLTLSYGFTIVELLIVIVVIGILAAITVVSFNNVTKRAQNVRTTSMVNSYHKAALLYTSENINYPPFPEGVGKVCLGLGYKDVTNDGKGDCGQSDDLATENAEFNTALSSVTSSLPQVSDTPVPLPSQPNKTWVGAVIHENRDNFTVDEVLSPYYIMYILDGGGTDCQNSSIVEKWDDVSLGKYGWPAMKTSEQKYSWTDNKTTACVVSLPNIE